jgi:isocitrate/isopropylmalate dehydrogenase
MVGDGEAVGVAVGGKVAVIVGDGIGDAVAEETGETVEAAGTTGAGCETHPNEASKGRRESITKSWKQSLEFFFMQRAQTMQ